MNIRKKQHIVTAVLTAVALLLSVPIYAATTQDKLDSAKQENNAAELDLISTQDRLDALEAQKGNSENYLATLSDQLDELKRGLTELEGLYNEKQAEIEQVTAELETAKDNESEQYEAMKIRIQYLYEESSSAGLLEALFTTDGFSDFLNRADAFSELTKYDREMLQEYSNTIADIEEKEAKLEQESDEIENLRELRKEQQNQIEAVYEAAYDELMQIESSIQSSESEKAALLAQIESQENEINQLLVQKYAEEAAAQAAAAQAEAAQAEAAQAEAAQATTTAATTQAQTVNTEGTSSEQLTQNSATTQNETSTDSTGNLTYLGNFKLTAYCSCEKCCGQWAANAGVTASGAQCVEGVTVAMAGVPFGTQLSINGHVYTVQDRGTAYGHVDIYFSSHSAALAFGLQYADVYQVG